MVRCITCNVFHVWQFCRFFYCLAWFDTVEFNRLPCQSNKMYDDAGFADLIPLAIEYIWNSSIDRAISTPSLSYCIWNRYIQNHRSILPNFLLLASFDTVEFNRLPCSKNKKNNDAVFGDRFRYELGMFRFRLWIGLSQRLDAHIAYEIDTAKIIATFLRISYCLHHLICLNSIVLHVQTARCTTMRFSLIDSAINLRCLELEYG